MIHMSLSKFLNAAPTWVKKVYSIVEVVFSLSSAVVLPAIGAATVLWLIQSPGVPSIAHVRREVTVEPGETKTLKDNVVINTTTPKAVYNMWLEDSTKDVVYRYPPILVKDPKRLTLGDRAVEFPRTLAPGTYSLMIEVEYMLNPLKTATVKLELARVVVSVPARY